MKHSTFSSGVSASFFFFPRKCLFGPLLSQNYERFLCLAEQISKTKANFFLFLYFLCWYQRSWEKITGQKRGGNMVTCRIATHWQPLIWGSWMRCRGMISGGEPVRWGAIKDPSTLIWSHPKRFIKLCRWPREVLGWKPKPQAFPLRDEKVILPETCFRGFPNFIYSLRAKIGL